MKNSPAIIPFPAAVETSVSRVTDRDEAVDTVRGIAIFMVIGIHSLQQPLGALETAIDAALRPAVPLFLFLSGYLTGRSGHVSLSRRTTAALIPYTIAFCAAYIYMAAHNSLMDHRPLTALGRYGLGYVFVYYYVPVYIACTLVLWGIMKLLNPVKQPAQLCIMLAIAAMFGVVVGSYLDPLLAKGGMSSALIEEIRLRDVVFWFSFVAVGAIVGLLRAEAALRQSLLMIAICAVAAYALYGTARVLKIGDAAPYESSAFFLYATLLALVLLASRPQIPFLAFAGSGSYFIYLWHIFIIMALRDHTAVAALGGFRSAFITSAITAAASIAALLTVRHIAPHRLGIWVGAR